MAEKIYEYETKHPFFANKSEKELREIAEANRKWYENQMKKDENKKQESNLCRKCKCDLDKYGSEDGMYCMDCYSEDEAGCSGYNDDKDFGDPD